MPGDCFDDNCGDGRSRSSRHTTSVRPSTTSAFSRSTSSSRSGKTHQRYHPRRHRRRYYLKARLLPGQCRCAGGLSVCPPGIGPPSVSSIPNSLIRSGYGKARLVLDWDPNTKLGILNFKIAYHKLYSFGNLQSSRVVGVEIRGPARSCRIIANIVVNALGIYLLQTGGESADSYVLGSVTLNKAKAQQLLKGEWYVVIRSLTFLSTPDGELSGPICFEREEKLSKSC